MTTVQGPAATPSPEPVPAPGGDTILLPPVPPLAPSPATGHGRGRVLALLVVVLAFLTASFSARNSDLWFHLATGRLLAQGHFSFGTDPFAYTTQNVYWACHSWLFDLGLYGLYGLVGGAGLVVLKALLFAVLAGVLLRARRPGSGPWVPVICTTLAVLAVGPRVLLHPACLSYLLLGLTLWLLWSGHERTDRPGWFPYVLLLPLFALWVNVDEWFLLGPVLVTLFWLGERLAGHGRTPAWLVPAGIAVCLLNPHTYRAFVLPSELSPVTWTGGLRDDARFQAVFTSPWSQAYLSAVGLHPASLAYVTLTLLGLASFVLHRPALWDWRLTVWLPFAALAAWQARAVPFFAVVAAPITALNWQDFLSERMKEQDGRTQPAQFLLQLSSFGLSLALLTLIAFTFPGWLAGTSREGLHVAWDVQPEPSLRRAALALHDWRGRGLLHDGERVFAVSPEVAQYAAWFAPGERFFFDHRYQLFPTAARDYEVVCRALLGEQGAESDSAGDWRGVLHTNGVGVVVFADRDPRRLFAVLRRVADDAEHWTLLDVAGQAVVVGWNEARPPDGFLAAGFGPDALAFGPQDDRARQALPAAPDRGPEALPARRDLRARFLQPPAAPSWESAAATLYLHYADDSEAAQRGAQMQLALSSFAAGLAGLPALPAGVQQAALQIVASRNLLFVPGGKPAFLLPEQLGPYFAHLVERQPALPLLAVRAARRAVAADPEDANAWLRLGQAYVLLRDTTCERSGEGMVPPLAQLRHVQIVTALEQALRLDPGLEVAHYQLHDLYFARNYLDQALEHRQKAILLSRQAAERSGETDGVAADRREQLEKGTAKLAELVEDRRKTFASARRSLQGDRLKEAELAFKLGLARQAVEDILLKSPVDLLGAAGIRLELHLLLSLGRADEVRAILADEGLRAKKQGLLYHDLVPPKNGAGGPLYAIPYHWPAYEWLHALQAAGVGDYAVARGELDSIRAGLKTGHDLLARQRRAFEDAFPRLVPGLLCGPDPFLPAFTAWTLGAFLEKRNAFRAGEPALLAQQADLLVLEGMLALEQGDTGAARSSFAEAEELGTGVPFAGAPIAARYLGKLNARR